MRPTSKQVELMKELGIEFDDDTTKEEATGLIREALDKNKKGLEDTKEKVLNSFPTFSQNYRDSNGAWKTVMLTAEELAKLRKAHRQYCTEIMQECEEDYPSDKEARTALFNKRADKVFTWIQQALDEKVRQTRK